MAILRRGSLGLALAALVAGSAIACSSLLGLGDFKDAPADGGVGQGGASGSAGSAGSAGTSGAGGAAGAAGAGGTAGAGGQPGLVCEPAGQPISVLSAATLGTDTLDSDALSVASSNGDAYVGVVGTGSAPDGGTGKVTLYARSLRNEGGQIKGGTVTYQVPAGEFRISSRWITGGRFHLAGQMDQQLADVSFQIGNNGGDLVAPAQLDTTASPCQSGTYLREAVFAFDGTASHTAVTCQQYGDGGTNSDVRALYVDGKLVDNGSDPGQALVARRLAYVQGTYVLVTGNDFGPPVVLRYGTTIASLKATHDFSLTTDSTRFSALFSMVPRADDTGLVALGAVLTGPPSAPAVIPADILGRFVSPASLGELAQTPAPGFAAVGQFATTKEIAGYTLPAVLPNRLVYAGKNPINSSNVHMIVVDDDAKVLAPNTLVYETTNSTVLAAAAGHLDVNMLIAWSEETSGQYSVGAQAMFCH